MLAYTGYLSRQLQQVFYPTGNRLEIRDFLCEIPPLSLLATTQRRQRARPKSFNVMAEQSSTFSHSGAVRPWVLGGVAVLMTVAAFHESLIELVRRWSTQEEYSHGFLVPLVTAWLL